jgi:hypothetical protein
MHRLTGRDESGNTYVVGLPEFYVPKYANEKLQPVADKLAAYEDAGLAPEDLKKAFNETAVLKLSA